MGEAKPTSEMSQNLPTRDFCRMSALHHITEIAAMPPPSSARASARRVASSPGSSIRARLVRKPARAPLRLPISPHSVPRAGCPDYSRKGLVDFSLSEATWSNEKHTRLKNYT